MTQTNLKVNDLRVRSSTKTNIDQVTYNYDFLLQLFGLLASDVFNIGNIK